ncbi:putative transposase [Orientia chuto str. Dubai]|uniref:Putative transposase n=1 Tax=Orientia chuto str. Dubai TaxID=1359168 RepID=A0A0F3MJA2_9RICK|nr:putative transposase [Orientia chuto str. Dubai]
MKKYITPLYYFIDDFIKSSNQWINNLYLSINTKKPTKTSEISYSYILTIISNQKFLSI